MRPPQWLPFPPVYGKAEVRRDIIAGLTVGILLIPQAMAYAMLAGVPPVYGIYASIFPMLAYAFLSSSPHVSVGPTALASILALSTLGQIVPVESSTYLNHILVLAGLTGLVQLNIGTLRLGVLISFLSRPGISGFVSAAAVLIAFSQLKGLLGLSVERTTYFHQTLAQLWQKIGTLDGATALVGIGSILLLLASKRWLSKWPGTLMVIILVTALTAVFNWSDAGLAVVGDIQGGLPTFFLPEVDLSIIQLLFPAALVLALISFVETLSIGKKLSENHGYYRISPNRELIALGGSKLIGAFFQAIPTSASFSRSAINEQN
ncbi:MAG: SulP family inorganic anion transporter, partial [Bacteroidota bacterium]